MSDLDRRRPNTRVAKLDSKLKQCRECYEKRAWAEAYNLLSLSDRASPLGADDLELLATSAYLIGREDKYLETLERAHRAHLEAGDGPRGIRCAFWLGLRLILGRSRDVADRLWLRAGPCFCRDLCLGPPCGSLVHHAAGARSRLHGGKCPKPVVVRAINISAHAWFGIGLYLGAIIWRAGTA
jgi:hypothetical protein